MHVGDAGDGEAVQLVREVGNGDVVPRDGDGRRLDEKPVAQRGGAEGAGSSDEKAAAGEGDRHGGKVTHPLSPSSSLTPRPPLHFVERAFRPPVWLRWCSQPRSGYRFQSDRTLL